MKLATCRDACDKSSNREVDVTPKERELTQKLADYMRADKALTEATEKWKARAEQAEREREETLRMWREYKAAKDADVVSADAARERAEADNAALLTALRDAIDNALPDEPDVWVRVWAVRDANHPGATLLERLRALERVQTAAVSMLGATVLGAGPFSDAERGRAFEELRAALAAADALEPKR